MGARLYAYTSPLILGTNSSWGLILSGSVIWKHKYSSSIDNDQLTSIQTCLPLLINLFGKIHGYIISLRMLKRMSTFAVETFNLHFCGPRTLWMSPDPHQLPSPAGKAKHMTGSVGAAQHLHPLLPVAPYTYRKKLFCIVVCLKK